MTYFTYKFTKIMGMTDFSDQFRKVIIRHKRIGDNSTVMRQSACLVINPITVDYFAARRWIGRRLYDCPDLKLSLHFSWFGPELFRLVPDPPGFNR